jgi:hypothetical protein
VQCLGGASNELGWDEWDSWDANPALDVEETFYTWPYILSSRFAASRCIPAVTRLYIVSVRATSLCPNRSAVVLASIPLRRMLVEALSYFEGLYLVPRVLREWFDRPGNVLSLCPTCCAKLQYGSVEADDILDQIGAFRARREGGTSEPALHIKLLGQDACIRFTERHMIDLQEMVKAAQ